MGGNRKTISFLCKRAGTTGLFVAWAACAALERPVFAGDAGMRAAPKVISVRKNASDLELLAAQEVRRYVYLRTGTLLQVKKGLCRGDRLAVATRDPEFCRGVGGELGPQQFTLSCSTAGIDRVWSIVGGDDLGTLYGAYRFAAKLGVRFGLADEVVPDEPLAGAWPEMNETGRPRFALRGLQPFHDFSVGPDWWNLQDYKSVLSQMAKMRLNFIGFHTYPSWNPSSGPEANVWIGLPEDVDKDGNVRFGYEAGVVTTRRGWEVKPFPTGQYASGAGLLFEGDEYGPDFMLECLDWPKGEAAAADMFNRYGDFQKAAFAEARRLGIKTCVGTELPLGVPRELAARLQAKGLKPDDPAVIRRLYEGTFLRLMRKMPVDYYWLWICEVWLGMEPGCSGWEITTEANVERDLGPAAEAAEAVQAPFAFATCGWRLGTQRDPFWLDKRTPKAWAASSINTSVGRDPVEVHYGAIQGRPKWVIGWAEDDGTAGAHCCTAWDLQLWVERMFANSSNALGYGCEGMMAIHWRTAAISPNIEALAESGWSFESSDASHAPAAGNARDMDAYWAEWGRGMFGGDAGAEAGRLMRQFDGSHPAINALIDGGANSTDAKIAGFFAPLSGMAALRDRIHGAGNRERLDYWLNLIRATELRVRTWSLADQLARRMGEARRIKDAEGKIGFARGVCLPLRLSLARSYEDMIAAFVRCAKSPGEIGTIASIESGMRGRIVSAHDEALSTMLGAPLPGEASISTAYRGEPRIFVSSRSTLVKAGERQEIRAFVLSDRKCAGVTLYSRAMGEGSFSAEKGALRARQAYRIALPAQSRGAVEYYLEATLDGGQKVRWPVTAPAINQTAAVW